MHCFCAVVLLVFYWNIYTESEYQARDHPACGRHGEAMAMPGSMHPFRGMLVNMVALKITIIGPSSMELHMGNQL